MKKIMIATTALMIAAVMPTSRSYASDFAKDVQNAGSIKHEIPSPEAKEIHTDMLPEVFYNAVSDRKSKAMPIEKDIYNTLAAVFEKAGPVTEKDLTGFFTGRAFTSYEPNKPVASSFAGQRFEIPINPQTGPLLEDKHSEFKFAAFFDDNDNPDFYDNLLADPMFRESLKRDIPGPGESYEINNKEAVAQWELAIETSSGIVKVIIINQARKYDKYLVLKTINILDGYEAISTYAYYWQP